MTAAISIIIPNLNSPMIGKVLQALQAQAQALSLDWEAWVVGQDQPGQVRADAWVHVIETAMPIPPSQARNTGAAAARGETLIFLDADCVPQPGWLATMLEAHVRWPDAGAISGAMLPDNDTLVGQCGQIADFHEHLTLNPAGTRRTLASFSLLVPRSVWQSVNGFDERLKLAVEDMDFSIRIARTGRRLYFEPNAAVRHLPQRNSWRALWRRAFIGGTQSIIVRRQYADHYGMPRWTFSSWWWRLYAPGIAIFRTAQIYWRASGLWRYGYCAPWVALSKLAWCWGAAAGLAQPLATSSQQSIRQYYDECYRADSKRLSSNLNRIRDNLRHMDIKTGYRIVDVGCGIGAAGKYLASRGGAPFGIDISFESIRIASRAGHNAAVLQANAEQLPFADRVFDAATFLGTLEHFIDPVAALREVGRVLKPRTRLCFVVPNSRFFLFKFLRGTGQLHERPRTYEGWRQLFEAEGLEIEMIYRDVGPGIFDGPILRALLRKCVLLLSRLLPIRYTYQFVFLCRKIAA